MWFRFKCVCTCAITIYSFFPSDVGVHKKVSMWEDKRESTSMFLWLQAAIAYRVMEPSTSTTSGHIATIKCLLNWFVPNKEESYDPLLHDCSIVLSSFENFWTSVLVCCFFVLVMLTTSCCLFLWWQKKKRQVTSETTTNLVVKPKRSAKNANTPIIRSQDIISFVLPSVWFCF